MEPRTPVRRPATHPPADLIHRDFSAEEPNHLWVVDIADVPTVVGLLSLAVVLDAFSRRAVDWSMATSNQSAISLPHKDAFTPVVPPAP